MTNIMDLKNCSNDSEAVAELFRQLEDKYNTAMIPAVIMMVIVAVVGLAGNILVLVVYSKMIKLSPTKVLMMTIASFDLVANVGAIPSEIVIMMDTWRFSKLAVCKLKVILGSFTTVGGALSLFAVAVVRYRKVCKPHSWEVTIRNAKQASLIAAIIAIICSIPYPIIYGIRTRDTPCPNIKGRECFADDHYFYTVWPLLNNILFIGIFIVAVTAYVILYGCIAVTAWKHREYHRNISKTKSKPNSKCKSILPAEDCVHGGLQRHEHGGFVDQTSRRGDKGEVPLPTCCCRRQRSMESEHNSQCSVIMNTYSSARSIDSCSQLARSEQISSATSSEATNTKPTKSDAAGAGASGLDTKSLGPSILYATFPKTSRLDERNHWTSTLNEKSLDVSQLMATNPEETHSHVSQLMATNPEETHSHVSQLMATNPEETHSHVSQLMATNPEETHSHVSQLMATNPEETHSHVSQLMATNPEETHSHVSQLKVTNPEETHSHVSQLKVTNPEETHSHVSQLKVTNPEETHSHVSQLMAINPEEIHLNLAQNEEKSEAPDSEDKITVKPTKLHHALYLYNPLWKPQLHNPESTNIDSNHDNKQDVTQTEKITEEHTRQMNSKKTDANPEFIIENGSDEVKVRNSQTDKSINKKDSNLQKHHSKKQRETTARNIRPRRIGKKTFMLIIISLIFLLSYIPFLILTIMKNRLPEKYASLDGADLVFYHFFYRLYFLNSASNPIVYSWCNINFRLRCIELLTCKYTRF